MCRILDKGYKQQFTHTQKSQKLQWKREREREGESRLCKVLAIIIIIEQIGNLMQNILFTGKEKMSLEKNWGE